MDSLETAGAEADGAPKYDHKLNAQLLSTLKANDADKLGEAVDRIFANFAHNRPSGLKYGQSFWKAGRGRSISAARMLRYPDNHDKVSGVLMIDMRQNVVSDILSELEFAPGTAVYLIAEDGRIAYHPPIRR